jgi:hypothetical protein
MCFKSRADTTSVEVPVVPSVTAQEVEYVSPGYQAWYHHINPFRKRPTEPEFILKQKKAHKEWQKEK